ncbi:GWxTD domain-containing protein [Balneolales bacterium ANBcel1]|nr:GWxTD domain-containing protein [Balneolales bacterium ANBcel1]
MKDRKIVLLILALAILSSACSRAFDPEVRTGSHFRPANGHPEILVSAISFVDDENNPVIDVSLDIIEGSLIYRERNGIFSAEAGVQIDVFKVIDSSDDEFQRVTVIRDSKTVESTHSGVTDSRDVISLEERIRVAPGRYRVLVTVTDLDSDQTASRSANVRVYDPNDDIPNLSHVQVRGEDFSDGSFSLPLSTYSIPGRVDTIRFEYQVTRPEGSPPLRVTMQLRKFDSDTSPPRPMSGITPSRGSIEYRGINYSRSEIIETQERILEQEYGTITIEYRTDRPPRGNYRFEVRVAGPDDEMDELFKARDFASMSDNFPHVITVEELSKPLVYLMRRREYRDLMQIEDQDSLKRAIDRFWLSNIGDKDRASRVIEQYYQRVEEANKQFSNFKEGWMTDMGMVYILFGSPWYVERSLDRMVWIYGYDRANPRRVFYFQRTRVNSDQYPFEHYILQRHTQYHSVEYEQIQRWLTGTILSRPI